MRTLLLPLLSFLISLSTYAYVLKQTSTGSFIKWDRSRNPVLFYVVSKDDGPPLNLKKAFKQAVSSWNAVSALKVRYLETTNVQTDKNNVYFSNSEEYFGGRAVLGVSVVSYYTKSGRIVESNILINTDLFNSKRFESKLLDVMVHELGHGLGLSHSEVRGSTMFYSQFSGQATLEEDDKSGAYALYPSGEVRGKISGKIIGGKDPEGIFGAHIQAISATRNIVAAGALSTADGSFTINGLEKDDTYFLYINPLKHKNAFSPYVKDNVQAALCPGDKAYVGSFFSACNQKASPQAIVLSSEKPSINVGEVSIRCQFDVSDHYLDAKDGGTITYQYESSEGSFGTTLTGLFSQEEFEQEKADRFSIELGDYWPKENDFLEINILFQGLYSVLDMETSFDSLCSSHPESYKCSLSPSNSQNILDRTIRVALNPSDTTINFDLKPVNYDQYFRETTCRSNLLYPRCETFRSSSHFYLLSLRAVKEGEGESANQYIPLFPRSPSSNIEGNLSCTDTIDTSKISRPTVSKAGPFDQEQSNQDKILGCGSLDDSSSSGGGGSSGLRSLFSGFILAFILLFFPVRKKAIMQTVHLQ